MNQLHYIIILFLIIISCQSTENEADKMETKKEIEESFINYKYTVPNDSLFHPIIFNSNKFTKSYWFGREMAQNDIKNNHITTLMEINHGSLTDYRFDKAKWILNHYYKMDFRYALLDGLLNIDTINTEMTMTYYENTALDVGYKEVMDSIIYAKYGKDFYYNLPIILDSLIKDCIINDKKIMRQDTIPILCDWDNAPFYCNEEPKLKAKNVEGDIDDNLSAFVRQKLQLNRDETYYMKIGIYLDENGQLVDVYLLSGRDIALNQKALDIIRHQTKWTSAKIGDNNVPFKDVITLELY